MADYPVDVTDIYEILKDIRDELPARTPVVVAILEPPSDCRNFRVNGVDHTAIALAVWSSGQVTPIYRMSGLVRTINTEEIWHFTD